MFELSRVGCNNQASKVSKGFLIYLLLAIWRETPGAGINKLEG